LLSLGENGSGKTTLIKLLAGLYHPTEGRITVDGHDISKLPANAWRNKVAVVFQDFMRYALTLRENITLSDREGIPEQTLLRDVLHRTGLDELANTLPDGLDTRLGRSLRGHDLSMGQWQRIALARALCRSTADILILDEPTSWQDAFEEFEVYRYFQQWAYPDKTIIPDFTPHGSRGACGPYHRLAPRGHRRAGFPPRTTRQERHVRSAICRTRAAVQNRIDRDSRETGVNKWVLYESTSTAYGLLYA
jgi:ABC-type transport system involved in cytochrome bd biosynthesis fused ATPase/permease subunit